MQDGYGSICMPWATFNNSTQRSTTSSRQATSQCRRSFSAIPLDPAHEQYNVRIKGGGGAVGLMDNPSALGCWMVAGPEMARLIMEFEAKVHPNSGEICHHDTTLSAQKAFAKDVRSILAVTKDPFEEDSLDLQVLDTKDTNTAVIETTQASWKRTVSNIFNRLPHS